MRRSPSKRSTKVASLERSACRQQPRQSSSGVGSADQSGRDRASHAPRVQPDQRHRVERQPAERRCQHRVQREPVERVRQRGEPVAQVGHLLLAPVAAPADHVRRDPALVERALEEAHAGGGAEQDHDVAVRPRRPDACSSSTRLASRRASAARHGGRAVERLAEEVALLVQLLPGVAGAVDRQQLDATARRAPARRARPGASRSGSNASPHVRLNARSIASRISPRARKFTVMLSARPCRDAPPPSARGRRSRRRSGSGRSTGSRRRP